MPLATPFFIYEGVKMSNENNDNVTVILRTQDCEEYAKRANKMARKVVDEIDRKMVNKHLPHRALTLLLVAKLIQKNVDFIYMANDLKGELHNLGRQVDSVYNTFFNMEKQFQDLGIGCETHGIVGCSLPSCKG